MATEGLNPASCDCGLLHAIVDPLTCPIRDAWHLATATMRRILDGMTLEILVDRQREIDRKRAAESNKTAAAVPPPAPVSG